MISPKPCGEWAISSDSTKPPRLLQEAEFEPRLLALRSGVFSFTQLSLSSSACSPFYSQCSCQLNTSRITVHSFSQYLLSTCCGSGWMPGRDGPALLEIKEGVGKPRLSGSKGGATNGASKSSFQVPPDLGFHRHRNPIPQI